MSAVLPKDTALLACALTLAFGALLPGSTAAQENRPPLLEEITNKRVGADPLNLQVFVAETTQFDVVASDPNLGDVLTYSLPFLIDPNALPATLAALGVSIVNTTDAAGRAIGRITIAPGAEDVGVWQLRVRVDDGHGGTDQQNVFVSVGTFTNQSPVFALLPPAEVFVAEGSQVTFSMTASDPDAGQTVTLSADDEPADSFTDGTSGNPVSATFSWTPAVGQAGDYTVFFEARDDSSPSITERVRTIIRVVDATCPAAPRIISLTPNQGPASGGTLVNLVGHGFCAPVMVTVGGMPATNLTVVSSTQLTFQTPPGTDGQAADVTVTAADGTAIVAAGFLYSGQGGFEPFAAFAPLAAIRLGRGANDDAFVVGSHFTLGPGSEGLDPLTEDVSLQVGTFATSIPAGSFQQDAQGRYSFRGVIAGVGLAAVIRPLGAGRFEFGAVGTGADLTGTVNPVEIGLTIGDDGGSTMVTGSIVNRSR